MKFILIAAVALLALAHGSYAQDATELEKLGQMFENMKAKFTQDLSEMMNNQDLTNQAQAFINDKRAQLEPLVAQLQEQLRTISTNMDEHIRPLAADVQAKTQPMLENLQQQAEDVLKKLMEQTQAIAN